MVGVSEEGVAGRVGGEEGEVAGGEVDEGVEDRGPGGGEAGGAEYVQDWGAEEGEVEGVGGHFWLGCGVVVGLVGRRCC